MAAPISSALLGSGHQHAAECCSRPLPGEEGVEVTDPMVQNEARSRQPSRWHRVGVAFAVVAAGLYLPFGWLGVMAAHQPGATLPWLRLAPILPGFLPGSYLFQNSTAARYAVMGATTLGLLAVLTSLGSSSRRRLAVAVGVALLVAVPSSVIAYRVFTL